MPSQDSVLKVAWRLGKDTTQMYAEAMKWGGRPPRAPRENTIKSNLCKFGSVGSFISVYIGVGFGGYEFRSRTLSSRAHIPWQFNPFNANGYTMYHLP
jgi:hypothetical protein